MAWSLRTYTAPDFSQEKFLTAPDAALREAPADRVAPQDFHAMSIFPEYFRINGEWLLAKESRMDCVPAYRDGAIRVVEPRLLKKGDLVVTGRTENCEDGIYAHTNGFGEQGSGSSDAFLFSRRWLFRREQERGRSSCRK